MFFRFARSSLESAVCSEFGEFEVFGTREAEIEWWKGRRGGEEEKCINYIN